MEATNEVEIVEKTTPVSGQRGMRISDYLRKRYKRIVRPVEIWKRAVNTT